MWQMSVSQLKAMAGISQYVSAIAVGSVLQVVESTGSLLA